MLWRQEFEKLKEALELERTLKGKFRLVEHKTGLASTANTDVTGNIKVINLDTSQTPLKCALSYAYELKNLNNAEKYENLIERAKKGSISRSNFVKEMIKIEAEAAYFRAKAFLDLGGKRENFPYNKEYLRIFDETKELRKEEIIKKFAQYILENGKVRQQFAAKKYYVDSFDYYSGKKMWPSFYDKKPKDVVLVKPANDDYFVELKKPKGRKVK
ncbi:hypothetical protein AQUSIP_15680 [Aquicella siphonis]|uniref:Uncharacterized protein n=1 Tax=Aquicella siphonis TaxID=254247 RepID=A0A5E4PH07_9COXI|nr:hypothetical protein [Aquicella siphonis]VVC76259.1 hypothetical protein AQUSIP_15680 [Aquicella siphonis]